MSGDLAHPAGFLDPATIAALRAPAPAAESARKLDDRQLAVIRERKWFKLFVPAQWGGLGLTLPQALELEEALAWVDGSTAWVVTLCGGAGWFAGFVDPAIRDELFASAETCLAGSGAVGGTAEVTGDGYLINGHWPHASGAEHATTFTANCLLTRGGQPLLDAGGGRQVAAFALARDEVTVHRTWNSMGMAATGSHAFEVRQVAVPAVRRFHIEARRATLPDLVYQYPFLQLAEATLAVNLSGPFLCTQAAAPLMAANGGGAVVNITSISGLRASTLRVAYGTSKAGLAQLTKQQAIELAQHGIRVNAVAPGPVDTAMAKAVHSPEIRAAYHDAVPLARYGLESELANAIVFLCSDKASYITGQVLAVDGGFEATGIGLPALRADKR